MALSAASAAECFLRISKRRNIVGKIIEMRNGSDSIRVEWQIPHFIQLLGTDSVFRSPPFIFLQLEWYLIYESSSTSGKSMFVMIGTLKKPVTYTIGIKQVDGTVAKTSSCADTLSTEYYHSRNIIILEKAELLKKLHELMPSGAMTVTCTLQKHEASSSNDEISMSSSCLAARRMLNGTEAKEEPRDICVSSDSSDSEDDSEKKGVSVLIGHLKNMLLEGLHHDVTIKVKNQKFKAHKDILRARSPVFAAMFKHDMEENKSDTVSIDDCDPDTFGEFLKYVYTGKAKIDSADSAISLYYAGDKYDFPYLKEMCVEHIQESLTTTTICDVIQMAKTHNEAMLFKSAVSFFSRNLEEILVTVEWQRFLQNNPIAANELYIKAVKSLTENLKKMCRRKRPR